MIPIECPKCGRGGSVPPDRLNARLVCKACHTVFHLDNTGRMVLGEPESFDMKSTKGHHKPKAEVSGMADFDLAQTWNDIPAPVKYGVPGVLLLAILWVNFGGGGGGDPDYMSRAESLVRAVTSNNKSKAVSMATSESAEAAGQWFDLVRAELEKSQIGDDVKVNPQLMSGDAEKDANLNLMVVLIKPGGSGTPVSINLPMKLDGGYWMLEATKSLEDAQQRATTSTKGASARKK